MLAPQVDEALLDSLTHFLFEPISKQFWQILNETDERSSTKANAKENANYEQQAE